MTTLSFLFPGQGSQKVGMGTDLIREFPVARQLFQQADELLGWSVSQLCARGPERTLRDSSQAQPAIFVHSLAVASVLEQHGHAPDFVAGHSLGELTALVVAGALSVTDGLRLVQLRGRLMGTSGPCPAGKMVAILGIDLERVRSLLEPAPVGGAVVIANENAPDACVLSGSPLAVNEVALRAEQAGAAKVVPLAVSGAFHSPLMECVSQAWAEAVQAAEISAPSVPILGNVTASLLADASAIRLELVAQLTSQVRWREIMEQVASPSGVSKARDSDDSRADDSLLVEIGPGKALRGLALRWARTARPLDVWVTSTVDDVRSCLSRLSEREARATA